METQDKLQYIKSCKAELTIKQKNVTHKIVNTELLRYHNITNNDKTEYIKHKYLIDFIKNIKLIGNYEQKDDIGCDTNKIYIGRTNFHNVIRDTIENITLDNDTTTYLCKILKNKPNPNKSNEYPEYFKNFILYDGETEIQYLKNNNGTKFYYKTEQFIIVPDIASKDDLFTTGYINNWNNILKKIKLPNDDDIIIDFLSDIQFALFIKDNKVTSELNLNKYKYTDVFSFTKKDIEEDGILNNIKKTIYKFYDTNFFENKKILDDKMIQIFINTDTKYNFVVINFIIFNVCTGNRSMSFIDLHRHLKLDELIDNIKNDDMNFYFTRVNEKNIKNVDCSDNLNIKFNIKGGYDDISKIDLYSDNKETLNILFDNFKNDNLKILNNKHYGNIVHSYCSTFYLIKIDNVIYEISFKSITYQILRDIINNRTNNNIYKEFGNDFWKCLKKSITNKNSINYKTHRYIFDELPGMVEIYIKKLNISDIRTPRYTEYISESKEQYNDVLKNIKNNYNMIDKSIIIHILWKSTFRNICNNNNKMNNFDINIFKNKFIYSAFIDNEIPFEYNNYLDFWKFTKKILTNAYIGSFILDPFIFNKNFTFNCKMDINNTRYLLFILNNILYKNKKFTNEELNKLLKIMICNDEYIYNKNIFIANYDEVISKNNCSKLFEQMLEYINLTSNKYILWYTPNLEIVNYRELHIIIDMMNDELNKHLDDVITYEDFNKVISNYKMEINNDKYNNIIIENNKIININTCTNFNKLFQQENFIHNIRHIYDHIEDIDKLIDDMYIFRKIKNNENFLVYAHYPNANKYNIFHMHTFSSTFNFNEKIMKNYINLTDLRILLWSNKLKYINYRDKTILLKFMGDYSLENVLAKFNRSFFEKSKDIAFCKKHNENFKNLLLK